jgi:DNA-binding NarL/FixJ family response regulator
MQIELRSVESSIPVRVPWGIVESPAVSPGVAKILIVDDHALLRLGIKAVLAGVQQWSLETLETGTLHDAIELYRDVPDIDLVLLDLNMSDCRGLQGLRRFIETFPDARVAVMSGTQDDFVAGQTRALGAVGYITKGQAPHEMAQIVVGLLERGSDAVLAGSAGAQRFPKSTPSDRIAELGPRHLEILDLLLFGCSNQEISNATKLSLGTIKNYVSTILLALDVKSRSHLISLFR